MAQKKSEKPKKAKIGRKLQEFYSDLPHRQVARKRKGKR